MGKDVDAVMGVIEMIAIDLFTVFGMLFIKKLGYEPEYVSIVVVLLASMTIGSIVNAVFVHDGVEKDQE